MILIINKNKKDSRGLAEMLHYMGILAYGTTPSDALSEISISYSAVIIMKPDTLASKEDYCTRLRSYANVPIFALTDTVNSIDSVIFDGVIKSGSYASKIFGYIVNYCETHSLKSPGTYKLAGIDASEYLNMPTYFNKALPFTKTETMLLRAMIVSYPTPLSAKNILKYAYRQSKIPELSNVRTHISVMNKKFRNIADRNIITLSTGRGYTILTPEMLTANAK